MPKSAIRKSNKRKPNKPKYLIQKAKGLIKDEIPPRSKSLWPNQAIQ